MGWTVLRCHILTQHSQKDTCGASIMLYSEYNIGVDQLLENEKRPVTDSSTVLCTPSTCSDNLTKTLRAPHSVAYAPLHACINMSYQHSVHPVPRTGRREDSRCLRTGSYDVCARRIRRSIRMQRWITYGNFHAKFARRACASHWVIQSWTLALKNKKIIISQCICIANLKNSTTSYHYLHYSYNHHHETSNRRIAFSSCALALRGCQWQCLCLSTSVYRYT